MVILHCHVDQYLIQALTTVEPMIRDRYCTKPPSCQTTVKDYFESINFPQCDVLVRDFRAFQVLLHSLKTLIF